MIDNNNTSNKDSRRHGRIYNKKELRENFEDIDDILQNFEMLLQELIGELDIDKEEINTEEVRSILKAMEYLCDDLDDSPLINKMKQNESK